MYIKELWRYPVKSMAGEQITQSQVTKLGLTGDREILVVGANGRVITSRTHPKLLGLNGTTSAEGQVQINGHDWQSPEALTVVQAATGPGARLIRDTSADRFDILPLLVATDGAIAHMGFDGRRLRPNIVIGGVKGLEERGWPGHRLQIGKVILAPAQLRGRCVMTTYDPDTLKQDLNILKRIVSELDGVMALDTAVEAEGGIRIGDPVTILA